jgi:holliday junction DNA helicase RuvB
VTDRLVSPAQGTEEDTLEVSLRPRMLADFPGQDRVKDNLRIAIEAAKQRSEPLDHQLFYGPPGLGKTTLGNIIAMEMGVAIRTTSGPAIERPADLAAILTNLKEHDVLFIDEIHRLSRSVEEILYPAMEDFALDGATTRYAMVSSPLRDRFGSIYRLDYYDPETLAAILRRSARILGVDLPADASLEIARRSRGTPRIANRLLRRARDYAAVRNDGVLDVDAVRAALDLLEVDQLGLDEIDRAVLLSIIQKFDGGPVGLETIAAAISEESDTIMDVYEPFLIQCGFLQLTPRGRMVTASAYRHLNLPLPQRSPGHQSQVELWADQPEE